MAWGPVRVGPRFADVLGVLTWCPVRIWEGLLSTADGKPVCVDGTWQVRVAWKWHVACVWTIGVMCAGGLKKVRGLHAWKVYGRCVAGPWVTHRGCAVGTWVDGVWLACAWHWEYCRGA